MVIFFDPDTHTYTVNGNVVPSVTQIINTDTRFCDEFSRQRGTGVHTAIRFLEENDLDESSLDPVIRPYVTAYKKFKGHSGFVTLACEQLVYSLTFQYAGTLDLYGWLNGKRVIIDVKSGQVPKTVGMQVAAYKWALKEMGWKVDAAYSLQLKSDSKYSLREEDTFVGLNNFLFLAKKRQIDNETR